MHVKFSSNASFVKLLFFIVVLLHAYLSCFHSVSDVVRMVTKVDIPPHKTMLELFPSFAEDEDCELVPAIRYLLL